MTENNITNENASSESVSVNIWGVPYLILGWYVALVSMLYFYLYEHGLNRMVNSWFEREEYSHGIMIPMITLFLVWQKKDILETCKFEGSNFGVGVVFFGVLLVFLGEVSAITVFIQYGFVFIISGVVLSYMGMTAFKQIAVPFALLFFMIPLPAIIFQELSQYLQLISTQIGVFVIRLFSISVYVEGNVIDLGIYQLQVVEACNGLRYLFPLMTLGFIAAYFYKVETWKRVVVFLSSVPITVLMNSFRIGVIGVTVEYWGIEMAEGFLHEFEGWIIFMACAGLMLFEMLLFAYFGKVKQPLVEVFGIELPAESPANAVVNKRPVPKQLVIASSFIIVSLILGYFAPERTDLIVDRKEFESFPVIVGDWDSSNSQEQLLPADIIDVLKFDDYLLSSYRNNENMEVNLYVAYYGSQGKGASIHSPRACLPGGGWQIKEFEDYSVPDLSRANSVLNVNRVLIQMGESKQLVYYWFPQRGRNITNEYILKWYVFWDSLTMNRSDGALVRVTTTVQPGENLVDADARLAAFLKETSPLLRDYIPE
ncbi:Eight transmembrane protein EpsH / EpsI protein [hydrothermal vent metagenome]|uniref:Eight transmembrane protein EpsH / EpsI protein n=1 Tax=hydrothermal vent metagenome TaxID=652676 RepID=A0A3B0WL81_9ZZZZ